MEDAKEVKGMGVTLKIAKKEIKDTLRNKLFLIIFRTFVTTLYCFNNTWIRANEICYEYL